MVRLRMMGLKMASHRGVPAIVMRVSERHGRGSERGHDENSKSSLENEFHGNPVGISECLRVARCNASGHCDAPIF
ncbi:hypothetical protein LMG28138_05874 [Pararobbsia alpina]|uniref:Uncharacterized protein n=1 Tax=Pararobbsia alpina TaxID=621374 RepID=A0A6S7BXF5_9BURK|nr:hypothetical protein LMG28138_05874 [Pararobbsia alpina]